MKLLGWMHRKLRQNGGYPSKDFNSGNPCNTALSGRPSLEDHYYTTTHRPITSQWLESAADPDTDPNTMSDLFQGLLTIGTLGSPTHNPDDPLGNETPTFGVPPPSVDSIAEKEEHSEATEFDLMVINEELDKVLVEGGERVSSVSAKQLVCPLQEYLLGAVAAETVEEGQQHKRTSLAELFMKSNVEEGGWNKKERPEKPAGVQMIVKKMLKRRGSSRFTGDDSGGGGHSAGCEKKLPKIMQMFHKKIHPENSVAAKKAAKYGNCLNKHCSGGDSRASDSDISSETTSMVVGRKSTSCMEFARMSSSTNPAGTAGHVSGRGQWIKTDADYLVLEL